MTAITNPTELERSPVPRQPENIRGLTESTAGHSTTCG
jgi:hypothetical protein